MCQCIWLLVDHVRLRLIDFWVLWIAFACPFLHFTAFLLHGHCVVIALWCFWFLVDCALLILIRLIWSELWSLVMIVWSFVALWIAFLSLSCDVFEFLLHAFASFYLFSVHDRISVWHIYVMQCCEFSHAYKYVCTLKTKIEHPECMTRWKDHKHVASPTLFVVKSWARQAVGKDPWALVHETDGRMIDLSSDMYILKPKAIERKDIAWMQTKWEHKMQWHLRVKLGGGYRTMRTTLQRLYKNADWYIF